VEAHGDDESGGGAARRALQRSGRKWGGCPTRWEAAVLVWHVAVHCEWKPKESPSRMMAHTKSSVFFLLQIFVHTPIYKKMFNVMYYCSSSKILKCWFHYLENIKKLALIST
jgi:hypothetical protein